MSQNFDNRRRAFADVVTIDAWHEDFADGPPTADLHADVVFGTARVGGESESPVRFRLSIKSAELVVIIPDFEPVSVDKSSVSRDAPEQHGRLTETVEQLTQAHAKGSIRASVSPTGLGGSGAAEAGAQASVSKSKKLEVQKQSSL